MPTRLLSQFKELREREDGVSLIELMVSFTIIVAVLAASALAMTAAHKTQTFTEARDKAGFIANGIIAEARQIDFASLAYAQSIASASPNFGGFGTQTTYGNEDIVIVPDSTLGYDPADPSTGNFQFMPYEEQDLGENTFQVWRYITKVKVNSTFDSAGNILDDNAAAPRRVTIVVRWNAGDGSTGEVVRSWVRVPSSAECIPISALDVAKSGPIPLECKKV